MDEMVITIKQPGKPKITANKTKRHNWGWFGNNGNNNNINSK